jgi:hypothetical protein
MLVCVQNAANLLFNVKLCENRRRAAWLDMFSALSSLSHDFPSKRFLFSEHQPAVIRHMHATALLA